MALVAVHESALPGKCFASHQICPLSEVYETGRGAGEARPLHARA
jgi:hypothetical protein